jgi:preprotein translocase subunit SecG
MLLQYIIGGILIALAAILVVVILSQTGKDKSLSGSIAGGSTDTYFGKSGGSAKEKLLTRVTIVLSILFVGLAVTLMILVK